MHFSRAEIILYYRVKRSYNSVLYERCIFLFLGVFGGVSPQDFGVDCVVGGGLVGDFGG